MRKKWWIWWQVHRVNARSGRRNGFHVPKMCSNSEKTLVFQKSLKIWSCRRLKSAELHGQSSPSELSSHQISPSARVPAHSSPSTRGDHLTQRMEERLVSHCRAKHPSHLVSDFCLPVGAVAPGSRHKDTTPRRSNLLSLFPDRSLAPNLEAGSKLLSGIKVQLEEIDVSLWQLNKARKWTTPSKNLLFQVQQGNFDLVCVTLPVHGMSRALFANSSGPSPTGFLGSRHKANALLMRSPFRQRLSMVYAFATMTRRSTGLLLFASEERGEAHFGEPCSWWQSSELQLMSSLGAHRGAFYTCEIAKRWGVSHLNKAGSLGVLSNFRLPVSCAAGWPRISESREYRGPLSAKCSCGAKQESIKSQKASSPAIHATVCAEFLTALHRLPEEKGELNTSCSNGLGNAVFSPVQDADSPALFLLSGQPWQQALLRSFSEQPDDVCTMKVLPVTKECEKELKRKLSDQVGGKEQTKSSRSEGSGVGVVGRRAGGGGFGAAGQSSSTVAKMVAKGVKRLASDVFTEARGSQLGKCGVARAVEPIRAELSSNLSECECPCTRARPS